MNSCSCGSWVDAQNACTYAPALVTKYQRRISGPLLDHIDTAQRIEFLRVDYEQLSGDRSSESQDKGQI
jgi:magnesium chelatase family protein